MAHALRVYLAGPDVFLPDAAAIGRRKKALCAAAGFVGLFPSDNEVAGGRPGSLHIFSANHRMMRDADLGLFNLTPFRGPSADVGTVFELGLMAGLGKPCFGYTNVASSMLARVPGAAQRPDGAWRDPDGLAIEDFGNADNLMIDSCLAMPGNGLVRVDAGGRLDGMEGFERCLTLAAETLHVAPGAHRGTDI